LDILNAITLGYVFIALPRVTGLNTIGLFVATIMFSFAMLKKTLMGRLISILQKLRKSEIVRIILVTFGKKHGITS
jgi:hypothetical protein